MPVVGYLSAGSREDDATRGIARAVLQGLRESGFVDGKNVRIEYRWAEGHYDRLPDLAADLVRSKVNVMVALATPATFAAKSATSSIPIIFGVGTDPVGVGLVQSLNRPEGNLTGVTILTAELFEKRVDLLRELVPKASQIAMLANPNDRLTDAETRAAQSGARSLGVDLRVLNASSANDIESAFATLANVPADALIVTTDPFIATRKPQVVALVARQKLPAIYPWREWIEFGGLMSYGADILDAYRIEGVYAGKVLDGTKVADLPVERSVKFELAFNLKAAKALELTVPPTLLARADQVIE
jgi:putative tryptophan/tyrosine transport system substrate-binding protein